MRDAKIVVLEAMLVGVLGLLFALAANALSPRGIGLGRNYFPGGGGLSARAQAGPNSSASANSTNLFEAAVRRLQQNGLQLITSNAVVELFRDVNYQQGLAVLIDARDDSHYQAGHIPGAWQLDHYHAEQYLPAVLPICLNAQKVVVYCNGGACEDSEFAAAMLRDAGVPRDHLFVYAGGISEWKTTGLPVETGARQSGESLQPKP